MRVFRTFLLTVLMLAAAVRAHAAGGPPFSLPPRNELLKIRSAILSTNKGDIFIELYPEAAPWHVANLKFLADRGFYRNLKFHLFHPGYIIQGGAPNNDPNGGPGYAIPAEFNDLRHEFGTFGMARWPDELNQQRHSHGSQFHILLGDAPHMNGSYTVMGKVVRGLKVLEDLRDGDTIRDLTVYVRE